MWIDDASKEHFAQEFQRAGVLVLEGIPLSVQHFTRRTGQAVVDLMFVGREGGTLVLTPPDLQPLSAAAAQAMQGMPVIRDEQDQQWLLLGEASSFDDALAIAGDQLGLGGGDPTPAAGTPVRQPAAGEAALGEGTRDQPVVVSRRDREQDRRGGGTRRGSALAQYGRDLTAAAEAGQLAPIVGREQEMARCIQVLLKAEKNCPCLVGEPGVGKTAVVEGLAQGIAAQRVTARLWGARIIALDLSALLAGASHKGEVEERVKKLLDELRPREDVALRILFVDEVHTIMEARGDVSLAELLKPHLSRSLRLIGATTHAEWKRAIEPDKALVRRLEPVFVPEPDREQTLAVLRSRVPRLVAHHGVQVPDEVLEEVVDLSSDYLPERHQPDKALDLLDEAMAAQALRQRHGPPEREIGNG